MNASRPSAGAILLLLLSAAFARGEPPMDLPFVASPGSKAAPASALIAEETAKPTVQAYAPDAWVYQQKADCCPPGMSGPIGTEIYARGGPSFPISGGHFTK